MTGRLLLLTLATALAVPVPAAEQVGGTKILVEGAWARRAPMMSGDSKGGTGNGAVYATLVNAGKEADSLVAAASNAAATVEIHESYRDMGMMMMRPVKKLAVPAGGKVEMKPGGYHVMLINLKRDLKPGEVVGLTLRFAKAGKIQVTAVVK